VLDWLGREQENPALWTVDDPVVLDIELMSPYLTDPPFPIVTYRELRAELEGEGEDAN
jgi:hypothetical protein